MRLRGARRARSIGWLAFGLAAAWAMPASAQDDGDEPGTISQPVVQALPDRKGMTLNDALGRLAQNPRDVAALVDAGNAALAMGDVDAATGFFKRAEQIAPTDARVKAGLACAYVRNGDPFAALPLFEMAEKAGISDALFAADHGLAYDLVGDNAAAQAAYRAALAREPNEEVTRRLALSLAISGDKRGSEAALLPLLRQQSKSAWRARAFALAIGGDVEQAVAISRTILPPDLANSIAPYLRYMPRLTRAQQVAAVNFGQFPRAADIGVDDPRIAEYAASHRAVLARADTRTVPPGAAPSRKQRERADARRASEQREAAARASREATARVAPPEIAPAIIQKAPEPAVATATRPAAAPVRVVTLPPPPVAARPAPQPAPAVPQPSIALAAATPVAPPSVASRSASPAPVAAQPTAPPPVTPAPSMSGTITPSNTPPPGFDLASIASPRVAVREAEPVRPAPPPPPAAKPRPVSLAEAFNDFSRPAVDATPAAGAVDIRRISAAKAKPREAAKPPPPSHPSRIWVQVATGRERAALSYDWRRMTREAALVFRGKQPFTSTWGQSNRLLTGPFESQAAAEAFLGQLRKAGIEGSFVWTSPAGQVVDPLAAR